MSANGPVITINSLTYFVSGPQPANIASMFSASDTDGTIVSYTLTGSSSAGGFIVNGQVVGGTSVTFSADQLNEVGYIAAITGQSDVISVQATDSNGLTSDVETFTIVNGAAQSPSITATQSTVSGASGYALNISSLFTVNDPSGAIASYTVSEAGNVPGLFYLNGQSVGSSYNVPATDLSSLTFVPSGASGTDTISITAIDAVTGLSATTSVKVAISTPKITITTPPVPPLLATDQIAVTSLFSASISAGTIDTYTLVDSGAHPGGFIVNGQNVGATATFAASDLGSVYFVAGSKAETDSIVITAEDSVHHIPGAKTTSVTVAAPPPPVITLPKSTITALFGANVAATSLFAAADPIPNSSIDTYTLKVTGANAGYFMDSATGTSGQSLTFAASDLGSVVFVAGTIAETDTISITAHDAHYGATSTKTISAVIQSPPKPVVTLDKATIAPLYGQQIDVTDLFSAAEPAGTQGTIDSYSVSVTGKSAGYFILDGDQTNTHYTSGIFSASQITDLVFVTGTAAETDTISIQAFDTGRTAYSSVATELVSVTTPKAATVKAVAPSLNGTYGNSVAATSLFTATPGQNPIQTYTFWDQTNSPNAGYFTDGVTSGQSITVSVGDLANVTFVEGKSGTDNIVISAADQYGVAGSVKMSVTVTPPVPTVSFIGGTNISLAHGGTIAGTDLVTATDPNNIGLTYLFLDNTITGGSGYFTLGGVTEQNGVRFAVAASQLGSLVYHAGQGTDALSVTVTAAGISSPGASTKIVMPADGAPTVTALQSGGAYYTAGSVVALTDLFSASDPENDTLTYMLTYLPPNSATSQTIRLTAAQFANFNLTALNAAWNTALVVSDGINPSTAAHELFGYKPMSVTSPASLTALFGANVAGSSLFSALDPEGTIDTYALTVTGTSAGFFVVNGSSAGQSVTIAASDLASLYFVAGTNAEKDKIAITAIDSVNHLSATGSVAALIKSPPQPKVTPSTATFAPLYGQQIAASSLFTAAEPKGVSGTIDSYTLSVSGKSAGFFVMNGVSQGQSVTFNASDLSSVFFVAGANAETDTISIQAFDHGRTATSAVATELISVTRPKAPKLSGATLSPGTYGNVVAASSLFTATPGTNPITTYTFWDQTNSPNAGYFAINGQSAGQSVTIAASDLANVTFVEGKAGTDHISITAADQYGVAGTATLSATVTPPAPSVSFLGVAGTTISLAHGGMIAGTDLVAATDPNGIAIQSYTFRDVPISSGTGHFVLKGVTKANGGSFTVAASDLGSLFYVAGQGTDTISVTVNDGFHVSKSAIASIVTPADQAPTVTALRSSGAYYLPGTAVAVTDLFSASDPENDSLTYVLTYRLLSTTNKTTSLTSAQFANFKLTALGSVWDTSLIVSDGIKSSGTATERFGYELPTVTAVQSTINASHFQSIAVSDLFTVSDPAGAAITTYRFIDETNHLRTSHFVGGTASFVPYGGGTAISSVTTDLSSMSFLTQGGSVPISIEVSDDGGKHWSIARFLTIATPVNHAPVVTTSPYLYEASAGTSVNLSALASATDADGDSIKAYRITHISGTGSYAGSTKLNSAFTVSASDFASAALQVNSGIDVWQVQAWDGIDWGKATTVDVGDPGSVTLSPGSNNVAVTNVRKTGGTTFADGHTGHLHSFQVTDLFTTTYPLAPDTTTYTFTQVNSGSEATGYFVLGGVRQSNTGSITVTGSQLSQLSFVAAPSIDELDISSNRGTNRLDITIFEPEDKAPVVTAVPNLSTAGDSTIAGTSLFTVKDPDGDPIAQYTITVGDGSSNGSVTFNGTVEAAGSTFTVNATDLALVQVNGGTTGITLDVSAWDGIYAGGISTGHGLATTVTVLGGIQATHLQSLAATDIFSFATIPSATKYLLIDHTTATNGGNFVGNGTSGQSVITTDLSSVSYRTRSATDPLELDYWTGSAWAKVGAINVRGVNAAPVVSALSSSAVYAVTNTLHLSDLFSVNDPDGDGITQERVYINGTLATTLTSAQAIANYTVATGAAARTIAVSAFDGMDWGQTATASVVYAPPTVTAGSANVTAVSNVITATSHTQLFAASDLFTVTDPEHVASLQYMLIDTTTTAGHGGFVVNGTAVSSVTTNALTSLSSVSFRTGVGGTDTISVQVNNGGGWTPVTTTNSQIRIKATGDNAPYLVVNSNSPDPFLIGQPGSTETADFYFHFDDNDGDRIVNYEIKGISGTGTVRLGNTLEGSKADFTTTDLSSVHLTLPNATSSTANVVLSIRAYDGYMWSNWQGVTIQTSDVASSSPPPALPTLASTISGAPAMSAVASTVAAAFDSQSKHQWGFAVSS